MGNYKIQVQTNEGIYLVGQKTYHKHKHNYFVGEDGIRFGHEAFSKMIIPKEVFIEAYNKYIKQQL